MSTIVTAVTSSNSTGVMAAVVPTSYLTYTSTLYSPYLNIAALAFSNEVGTIHRSCGSVNFLTALCEFCGIVTSARGIFSSNIACDICPHHICPTVKHLYTSASSVIVTCIHFLDTED
jgi:hypothetical protein